MGKSKKQRNVVLPSDLSERQIEKDVSAYVGHFIDANGVKLRLLDSKESVTGADAQLPWRGRLIYLQFKAPKGLTALREKAPLSTQPARKIRKYRFENDLQQEPYSVYFKLRALAETATIYQHNLLYDHDQKANSRACYVVPTVLKSADYASQLFQYPCSPLFHDFLFINGIHRVSVNGLAKAVAFVPFLRSHAVIRPHARVTTHEHHYSVSIHGGDVAFHSEGQTVSHEIERLSDFLSHEILDAYEKYDQCPSTSGLALEAFEISQSWSGNTLGKPEGNGLEWLQNHGRKLREEFGINQFILLLAK